jgi:hypothetical protein
MGYKRPLLATKRHNVCICLLSSRRKVLPLALKSLWNNYNFQYSYDVCVYYFDDIYDGVRINSPQNVTFIRIPYGIPPAVKFHELFYNLPNRYARSFGRGRVGYLHMCNFLVNQMTHPGSRVRNYDYVIWHDDEGGYENELAVDPVELLARSELPFGAYISGKRLKSGSPHQGHLDTRIGLFDLVRDYCLSNGITPISPLLQNAVLTNNESLFHHLDWCDTYVMETSVFRHPNWIRWIETVNRSGGIYKYRWGDNEIFSLYAHLHLSEVLDLGLVRGGYYNQGKFRGIQDRAPSVAYPDRYLDD